MSAHTVLVFANPTDSYLKLLDELPSETRIVVGNRAEAFTEAAPEADVLLVGMGGKDAFRATWPLTKRVCWIHSLSAGIEGLLTPDMIASPVPLTNAAGVFAWSLGEFAVTSMLYFAKDLPRMLANQRARRWEQYDVDVLCGKTLGIVGYGGIGRASAERAKPFGMKIAALRRRPDRSKDDPLVDEVYTPDRLKELLAISDYVVVAAALTDQTRGLIGEAELRAMKPNAVIINLGRGPVIVESALIRALEEQWIRGAALDVFDVEPLPSDHVFWGMQNVLLSPHCADHTEGWLEDTMRFFLRNFERLDSGAPLENVVDKAKGY